jgi:hypothetical protein
MQPRCALIPFGPALAAFFLCSGLLPAAPDAALQPVDVLRLVEQARINIFQIAAPSVVILEVELAKNYTEPEA